MMMSMLVAHLKDNDHAGLGSPGIDELRWLKPVYPGDTLRCETEILEKNASRSRPEMGSFRSRMTVFNQENIPVMTFVSIRSEEHTSELQSLMRNSYAVF